MLNYGIVLLVIWCIFYVYWFVAALGAKKMAQGSLARRGAGIRIIILIFIVFLIFWPGTGQLIGANSLPFKSSAAQALGLFLCACGIAFAIWARVNIGRNWGMPMSLKEGHELVTSGPYRFVRHPIYIGILFALLTSTLVGGYFWLLVFFLFGIYFVYASKTEEGIMTRQFPDQYPAYKKRTKMLIPFVF